MTTPPTRVGIIGGGWPGMAHLRGYRAAGGFVVGAVADLIPQRRAALAAEAGDAATSYASADELLADASLDAVSICLPTHLHLPVALAALKKRKHVMLETPPALSSRETGRLGAAAAKAERLLGFAFQRRFGGPELAAQQVIDKGYLGDAHHVRASWMRTRGIPAGTGWYTDNARSGGGALIDLGLPLLDLAWNLLGRPNAVAVSAITKSLFRELTPADRTHDVEDFAVATFQFDGGKTLELACSWAANQAPGQNGTACRVFGSRGAVEVYTPQGPLLYRNFDAAGNAKATPLKQPKVVGHAALLRQFRECILGNATPAVDGEQAVSLMRMIEAAYGSAESGKTVGVRGDSGIGVRDESLQRVGEI
jgi:predicted dehydrogenase